MKMFISNFKNFQIQISNNSSSKLSKKRKLFQTVAKTDFRLRQIFSSMTKTGFKLHQIVEVCQILFRIAPEIPNCDCDLRVLTSKQHLQRKFKYT